MRVLDVYPTYCWSFEGENPATIRQMRVAASVSDEEIRASEFDQIDQGEAYRLVGDAAAFELSDDFFDEIRVEYAPTVLKSLILRQKCKRWLKPGGRLYLPDLAHEPEAEPAYVPLRRPVFVPA